MEAIRQCRHIKRPVLKHIDYRQLAILRLRQALLAMQSANAVKDKATLRLLFLVLLRWRQSMQIIRDRRTASYQTK